MVDILLATYNGEKYLSEQIMSLINQTYKDIRIIIRDDGSTDDTIAIIEKLQQKYSDKIILIHDEIKCGSAKSNFMNLLKYASAEYVMFCDQDDYWFPEKVQATLECMKANEQKKQCPLIIYSDYIPADSELNPIDFKKKSNQVYNEKLDLNHLLVQNYINGCAMMINKELYQEVLIYQEEMLMHDWWLAIYGAAFGKIVHLKKELMYYRQHGKNCVGAVNIKSFSYIKSKILDKETKNANVQYVRQARAFYELYGKKMSAKKRKVFETFLNIPNQAKIQRIFTILKGRYLKNTFVRILGQLWYS